MNKKSKVSRSSKSSNITVSSNDIMQTSTTQSETSQLPAQYIIQSIIQSPVQSEIPAQSTTQSDTQTGLVLATELALPASETGPLLATELPASETGPLLATELAASETRPVLATELAAPEMVPETENCKINKIKKNLVLSGGGIKGIVHIGGLYALEELGYLDNIETFAGTSVGGLMLGLYMIGYRPSELYEFIKFLDISKLKEVNILNIDNFGLDSGGKIEYVIRRLISEKGYSEFITLKELYEIKRKKIIFTTVCINTMKLCYITYESYPDIPLYLAIRMSISIPFYYCPVLYNNSYYVDGGCFDNYPIRIFSNELDDTLGICIRDTVNYVENIENLETYILRLLETFMHGMTYNLVTGYEGCTINVHVESINIINYDIDDNMKDELFMRGYQTVCDSIQLIT